MTHYLEALIERNGSKTCKKVIKWNSNAEKAFQDIKMFFVQHLFFHFLMKTQLLFWIQTQAILEVAQFCVKDGKTGSGGSNKALSDNAVDGRGRVTVESQWS